MNTESDPNLSLTSRPFRWKGAEHLSVSAMSAFSFDEETGTVLLPEAEIWPMAAPVLEQCLALEEGFPKPGKEFFVAGSAFAPSGKKAEAVTVSALLGELRRDLRVTGDRHWKFGNTMSSPEPFTQKPLDWQHTAGDPENPANPLGKTGIPDPETGKLPVPNILDAKEIPVGQNSPLSPATMLPKGSAWPSRSDTSPILSGAWPDNTAPGELPENFNWEWFHTANPAQRGKGKFKPGEVFTITGMHPEKQAVSGKLPVESPWARVESISGSGEVRTHMVQLQPDTVWLFPEQERGVMIWHGIIPLAGAEASEGMTLRGGYGIPPIAVAEEEIKIEALPSEPPPAPEVPELSPLELAIGGIEAGEVVGEELVAAEILPGKAVAEGEAAAMVGTVESGTLPEKEEEAEEVEAALPKTEEERGEEIRQDLREIFDSVAESEEMKNVGEELDYFNSLLAEAGMEPVTKEAYLEYLPKFAEAHKKTLDEIPVEILAQLNPDESKSEEELEKEVSALIEEKLLEMGLDQAKAAELSQSVFDPLTEAEMGKLDEILEELSKLDLGDVPLSAQSIKDGTFELDEEQAKARLDELAYAHFNKDFDTLMSPDDDTIPLPTSIEELLQTLHLEEDDLPREARLILDALKDDVDDETFDKLLSEASVAYEKAMEFAAAEEAKEEKAKAELKAESSDEEKPETGLKPEEKPLHSDTEPPLKPEEKTLSRFNADPLPGQTMSHEKQKGSLSPNDIVDMEQQRLEKDALHSLHKDGVEFQDIIPKESEILPENSDDDNGKQKPDEDGDHTPDDIFGDAMR